MSWHSCYQKHRFIAKTSRQSKYVSKSGGSHKQLEVFLQAYAYDASDIVNLDRKTGNEVLNRDVGTV